MFEIFGAQSKYPDMKIPKVLHTLLNLIRRTDGISTKELCFFTDILMPGSTGPSTSRNTASQTVSRARSTTSLDPKPDKVSTSFHRLPKHEQILGEHISLQQGFTVDTEVPEANLHKLHRALEECRPEDQALAACAGPKIAVALLKLWLQELPEPLLNFGTDKVLEQGSEQYIDAMTAMSLFQRLPQGSQECFRAISSLLRDVERNKQVNGMSRAMLAHSFAPYLLKSNLEDPMVSRAFFSVRSYICTFVIFFPNRMTFTSEDLKPDSWSSF